MDSSSDTGFSNSDNLTNDQRPIFTGNTEANASVNIYAGDVLVGSGIADENGDYSIQTNSLSEGTHNITSKSFDDGGNELTSQSLNIEVDITTRSNIEFNETVEDNTINLAESKATTISGSIEEEGRIDSIQIIDSDNNKIDLDVSNITIEDDGTFSVPDVDLTSLLDGTLTININSTDKAGNTTTSSDTIEKHTSVDIEITSPIEGDNIVNDAEQSSTTISGNTNGIQEGQIVSIVLSDSSDNKITVETEVDSNGLWSIDVDTSSFVDGDISLDAQVSDIYANSASDTNTYLQDTTFGTITLDEISDNFINSVEHNEDLEITGTTTGIEDGQTVTLAFNEETYTGIVNNGSFSVIVPSNDVISLEDANTYIANVKVSDVAGNEVSDSEDVVTDFTINSSDDSNSSDLVKEDNDFTANGNLLSNDDTNLTVTNSGSYTGTYGTLTINSDGTYEYSLNNNSNSVQSLKIDENVSDEFSYSAKDEAGNITTSTVSINIQGTNDAPIVNSVDLGSINEDAYTIITQEQLLANASDIDGDNLEVTQLSVDPSIGVITQVGDNFRFTPVGNFNGEDIELNFTVSDGTTTVQQKASIDVIAQNDDVDARDDSVDESIIKGSDGTYDISSFTTNTIEIDISSYYESAGYENVFGMYYANEDGTPISGEVIYSNSNELNDTNYSTQEVDSIKTLTIEPSDIPVGATSIGFFLASDANSNSINDGDTISFNEVNGNYQASINGDTLNTNAPNDTIFFSNNDLNYSSDSWNPTKEIENVVNGKTLDVWEDLASHQGTDTYDLALNIDVRALGTNSDFAINEDQTVILDVLANDTDIDGDEITITSVESPVTVDGVEVGTASIENNQIKFVPNDELDKLAEGVVQDISFDYTISDNNGSSDSATITLKVTGTNDTSIITDDTNSIIELADDTTSINKVEGNVLNNNDIDADENSTFTVTSNSTIQGEYGTLTINSDGTYSYELDDSNNDVQSLKTSETMTESFNIDIQVDNLAGNTSDEYVNKLDITITGTNDKPILEGSSSVSFTEGGNEVVINNDITISDVDDTNIDSATISIENYVSGEDSLNFINQNGISGSFDEETGILSLSGSASKEDYESALESITYLNSSNLPDLTTRDITFTINDGEGNSNTINSQVDIAAVNDAPTISVDDYEVDKDEGYLTINLNASDVDSDISSFTLTTLPENGTLYLDSGLTQVISTNTPISSDGSTQVYFKPDYGENSSENSFGQDWFDNNEVSFNFYATDSGSQGLDAVNSSIATISIEVDDVPFVFDEADVEVTENDIGSQVNTISGNVLTNDYEGNDGAVVNEVTFTAGDDTGSAIVGETTSTAYGDLTINEDGSWEFTPDSNLDHTNGDLNFSFEYNIKDSDGDISENSASQNIIIHDGTDLTIDEIDTQSVSEANLSTGTNSDEDALTVNGSLNIQTGSDTVDVVFTSSNASASYETTSFSEVVDSDAMEADGWNYNGSDWVKTTQEEFQDTRTVQEESYSVEYSGGGRNANNVNANSTAEASEVANGKNHENGDLVFKNVNNSSFNLDNTDDLFVVQGNSNNANINLNNGDNTVVFETNPSSTSINAGNGIDCLVLPGDKSDYDLSSLNDNNGVFSGQILGPNNMTATINNFDGIKFADSSMGDISNVVTVTETQETFTNTRDVEVVAGEDDIITKEVEDENVSGDTTLHHNGTEITYEISNDGHTLTGKAGDVEVFTVEITDPSNVGDGTGYEFTLLDSIDHKDENISFEELDIPFNFIATDIDGDSVNSQFTIKVVDDAPLLTNNYTINEDNSLTFNISADRVTNVSFDNLTNGSATYDEETGVVTYTPNEDFSGFDEFTYSFTDPDGTVNSATATVDVLPKVENDTAKVTGSASGNEDEWISLDISAPEIKDLDDSETLSDVTISNIPEGSLLKLDDGTSINILNGEATVSIAEIENLQIKAPEDSNEEFTLETSFKVTDTAINSQGETVTNERTFTSDVNVNVVGIADDTSISGANASALEQTNNLDNIFSVNELISSVSFGDSDDSEIQTISISGLPEGTVLESNKGSLDGDTLTFNYSDLDSVQISFPNVEGDNYNLTIESKAVEDDNSSSITTSSTTAILTVNALANEIKFSVDDISTVEDTAVNIGVDVINSNPDLDGSETISAVEISSIPVGAKILDENGTVLFTSSENNTTFTSDITASDLESLQVLPPLNSADDFDLSIRVKSTDEDTNGDVSTWSSDYSLNVEVTADADTANIQIDNQGGLEDNWIALGAEVSTEDSSENIIVSLSNAPAGTTFKYSDGSEIHTISILDESQSFDIEASYLNSAEILAPKDFSGDISLNMTTKVIDSDGNYEDIDTYNNTINISVEGVADTPILSVSGASGDEDTAIALNIKAELIDTDGSESLEIILSDVPDDAVLSAGTKNSDGTWSLEKDDLSDLTITPPHDSSDNFDLTVTAKSTESDGDTQSVSFVLPVQVKGVAEELELSANTDTQTVYEDTHTNLGLKAVSSDTDGSEQVTYSLENIPDNVTLYLVDENGDALKNDDGDYLPIGTIKELNDDSSDWIIEEANLENIVMIPPSNYSGEINMNFKVESLESDGDIQISEKALEIDVKPKVENISYDSSESGAEDTWINLSGNELKNGLTSTGYDNEEVSNVVINDLPEGVSLGVYDGTSYITITPDENGSYSLSSEQIDSGIAIKSAENSNENISINVTRTLTDRTDNGEIISSDVRNEDFDISINISGDADSLASFEVQNIETSLNDLDEQTISLSDAVTSYVHSDTDGSESSTYFVIESSDESNTSFIVENGINAGNDTWIIKDIDTASIKVIDTTSGDGSLNLKITPFVREDDGDILEDISNINEFSISYDLTDTYTLPNGPSLDVSVNSVEEQEDNTISESMLSISASDETSLSYVVDPSSIDNASVIVSSEIFVLPNGNLVSDDISSINLNPSNDFSGTVSGNIEVIGTDATTGISTTVSETIDVNLSPIADEVDISAKSVGDEDTIIDLPIALSFHDNDGSESIVNDEITLILKDGGVLSTDNNSETLIYEGLQEFTNEDGKTFEYDVYTVSNDDLAHLQFESPENEHGDYNIDIEFKTIDSNDNEVSEEKEHSSSVKVVVESKGDDFEFELNDTSDIVVDEDTNSIDLGLSMSLGDNDGSELGYIVINNVPNGASLNHGFCVFDTETETSTWYVNSADASSTSLLLRDNFSSEEFTLEITASRYDYQSKEIDNSDSIDLGITVNPIADSVVIYDGYTKGLENSQIDMNLSLSLEDNDGSETLNLSFSSLPVGSCINNGSETYSVDSNGEISVENLSLDEALALTFTPPLNYSGELNISVQTQVVDKAGNLEDISDIFNSNLVLEVSGVASGFETNNISATISDYVTTDDGIKVDANVSGIKLNDTDGSESVTLNISGLGDSALVTYEDNSEIKNATQNTDGSWSITLNPTSDDYEEIFENITISASNADDLEGDIVFSATAFESNGLGTTILTNVNVADYISDEDFDGVNNNSVSTLETVSVALGLTLPSIAEERLGAISIDLPNNLTLVKANNQVISSNDTKIIIVDEDGNIDTSIHALDVDTSNCIQLTQNEFNTLKVDPSEDFTGSLSVNTTFTAFEVDDSLNTIEGIDSVSKTVETNITVDEKDQVINMSDNDGEIATGDIGDDTINMGDGNNQEAYGEEGDDTFTITLDEEDIASNEQVTIDGGEGKDTIVVQEDTILDFDSMIAKNIEEINLENNNQLDNSTIDVQDVINATDDDNVLEIVGDSGDEIGLTNESGDTLWEKSDDKVTTEDGDTFDVWTNDSVTVYIDEDITVTDF